MRRHALDAIIPDADNKNLLCRHRASSVSPRAGRSRLERTAAAATLGGVGVVEGEAPLIDPLVEIERSAVEKQIAFFVDDQGNTVLLTLAVGLGIPLGVEAE